MAQSDWLLILPPAISQLGDRTRHSIPLSLFLYLEKEQMTGPTRQGFMKIK